MGLRRGLLDLEGGAAGGGLLFEDRRADRDRVRVGDGVSDLALLALELRDGAELRFFLGVLVGETILSKNVFML